MKTSKESSNYFGYKTDIQHPNKAFTHNNVPSPASAFTTGKNGMNTAITINQKAPFETPHETMKDGLKAYRYLVSLTGMVSAHMRKEADKKKNPEILYDSKLWQRTVENIPHWRYSDIQKETFNQHISGTKLSTSFLTELIGFTVDLRTKSSADALKGFSNFLKGLGENITYGKTIDRRSYNVMNLTFGCRFDEIFQGEVSQKEIILKPFIQAYFINFSESDKRIYSTCGSHEEYDYMFEYGLIKGDWNYELIKSNEEIKNELDHMLFNSEIDDITRAENYFGCAISKSKKMENNIV